VADSNTPGGKTKDGGRNGEAVVIKKYANRRLYNTATSTYVTLEDLAKMVRDGVDFVVFDAKTNEELTRQILTQIIFEEESRGQALLPVQFLRQLIGFYGGQMEGVLPSYLEMSLENFSRQQEQFRDQMQKAFAGTPGAGLMSANFLEAAAKQNMVLFQNAMKMFPAFAYGRTEGEAPSAAPSASAQPSADPALDEMRRQMDEMRAQIDRLAGSGKS
jgi:polyhydroxyalkanoate synthesis repressor PhaR